MKAFNKLLERIIQRVNVNLRESKFNVAPYVKHMVTCDKCSRFYAFYGVTSQHPLNFHFTQSSLSGSYFLGKCRVKHSILYKTDVRGDELKHKGDRFPFQGKRMGVLEDERIRIEDSCLMRTLVHNFSHDPENLEEFRIFNTFAAHFANIHGAPTEGSFLGSFATVDLTTVQDSIIGNYSYIQAEEISHTTIDPGTIWVRYHDKFNFRYQYPQKVLKKYIDFGPKKTPKGILIDFSKKRKKAFLKRFDRYQESHAIPIPKGTSIDNYAVLRGKPQIKENVIICQRAYVENSYLGKGANAQENCFVINSRLEGNNVTAHGAKIIHAKMGKNGFVGFNSFLRGKKSSPLTIGQGSIVMPHTIIDLKEPVKIPPKTLVWGYISRQKDLETQTYPIEKFKKLKKEFVLGDLYFEGDGSIFIQAFQDRIHHILEANGAFFDGKNNRGHAQKNRLISFNTIQPYPEGELRGVYPTIEIRP